MLAGLNVADRHVLGVVASALVVALGFRIGDPIVGLVITLVILKITWDSWHTVRRLFANGDHSAKAD